MSTLKPSDCPSHPEVEAHRALGTVLDVVYGQTELRLLADVGVLEEGHTTEEGRAAGSLGAEQSHCQGDRDRQGGREGRRDCEVCALTSMTSVWPCLVQKACGGVVQLTATKLLGFRSRDGGSRSLQAEIHTCTHTYLRIITPEMSLIVCAYT